MEQIAHKVTPPAAGGSVVAAVLLMMTYVRYRRDNARKWGFFGVWTG